MDSEVRQKAKGIRVDVPSYLVPDDYERLTNLCLLFEDGQRCHMGVGDTRIFLVDASSVTEANEILRRYDVQIINGKQVRPGIRPQKTGSD